jgi:hypothetical protein
VFTDSITGATRIVESWRSGPAPPSLIRHTFTKNVVNSSALKTSQRNLALIAHDGRKMDLMLFVMQNLKHIITFDFILATGTTGSWLVKFLKAAWPLLNPAIAAAEIESKVICCESGPRGGDVQIAEVALRGLCSPSFFSSIL